MKYSKKNIKKKRIQYEKIVVFFSGLGEVCIYYGIKIKDHDLRWIVDTSFCEICDILIKNKYIFTWEQIYLWLYTFEQETPWKKKQLIIG